MKYGVKSQRGGVAINIAIGIAVIIGLTVYWQVQSDRDEEAASKITETVYESPGGEFSITLPTSWSVGEESYESQGVVSLDLYGPRNQVVNTAFKQLEGVESESIEEALSANRISELVDSPVGQEYVLIQLTVTTATYFDLHESKDDYQLEILGLNDFTSGVTYGDFTDFNTPTADGWKFPVTLYQVDDQITATSYYLLGDYAEAEALVYPANSNYAEAAEEIIKTLQIYSEEI